MSEHIDCQMLINDDIFNIYVYLLPFLGVKFALEVPEEKLDPVQCVGPQTSQDRDEVERHNREEGYISSSTASSAEEVDISQFVDSSSDEELEEEGAPQKCNQQDASQQQTKPMHFYREITERGIDTQKKTVSDVSEMMNAGKETSQQWSTGPQSDMPKIVSTKSLSKSPSDKGMLKPPVKLSTAQPVVKTAFHAGLPQVVYARSLARSKPPSASDVVHSPEKAKQMPIQYHSEAQKDLEKAITQLGKDIPILYKETHAKEIPMQGEKEKSSMTTAKQIPIRYRSEPQNVPDKVISQPGKQIPEKATTQPEKQIPIRYKETKANEIPIQSKEVESHITQAKDIPIRYKNTQTGLPKVVSVTSLAKSNSELENQHVPKSSVQPENIAHRMERPHIASVTSLAKSKPNMKPSKTPVDKSLWEERTVLLKLVPPISLAKPKSPIRSQAAEATWAVVSPKVSPLKTDGVVSRNTSKSSARLSNPGNHQEDCNDTGVSEMPQTEKNLAEKSGELESQFTTLKTRAPREANADVSDQTSEFAKSDKGHIESQQQQVKAADAVLSGNINARQEEDSIEDLLKDQGITITPGGSVESSTHRDLESSLCDKDASSSKVQSESHSLPEIDQNDVTEQTGNEAMVDETQSAIANIPQPSRTPSPDVMEPSRTSSPDVMEPSRTPSPDVMEYNDSELNTLKDHNVTSSDISENGQEDLQKDSESKLNNDSTISHNTDEQSQAVTETQTADTNQNVESSSESQSPNDKKSKVDLMSCLAVRENPDGTMRVVLQGEYDDDAVEEFFARPEVMDYLEKLAMKKTQKNNPINNLF